MRTPEADGMVGRGLREQQRHVLILKEDPDLAQGLSPADRNAATSLLRAPVIQVTGPSWRPPVYDPSKTFGLLVLDGLLGRRVLLGKTASTELLGAGDILRPWEEPYALEMIRPEVELRVHHSGRVALLDERITAVIGRRSQLIVNFSNRLLRRARNATYLMVISHLPRVEDRVLATLWHVASNWGRVTPEGVSIPFRLTHEILGEIVGAHRPTVTVAIQTMQGRGQLRRRQDGGYVLLGDPPAWVVGERIDGTRVASAEAAVELRSA